MAAKSFPSDIYEFLERKITHVLKWTLLKAPYSN